MLIYRNINPLQAVIGILILIALLVAGFFIFWALLPVLLVIGAYIWYKVWKMKKTFREAQANMYNQENPYQSITYIYTDGNGETHYSASQQETTQTQDNSAPIYDIKPEDYTVEEKK